ncbi:MAG: membrane protein insertase YidC [Propionibacteriaceae bacterium]|jgi:YidC/Oxa1 family membrane protein insertase|nr:membrane protein insertase YidC [Propionibacteriaceae bacterium]
MMTLMGIGDFFNTILSPIETGISFILMYAYKGLSFLIAPNLGVTWILAIMTLTVIVRTLLIPLFIRQINSARSMQVIQPKIKELQEKYGADRERLAIEQQKMMKTEGVNPMASCLPMLLQMPVFFALFWVLRAMSTAESPELYRGYFFKQNPDLVTSFKGADFFGAQLSGQFWTSDWSSFGATQVLAIVLVISMSALFFITQKQITGKNMAPEAMQGPMAQQQKMMLYLFPVMYLFMGMFIPIGVLIYWVTNNLWTMGQQWLMIRNNPTPNTPAYIMWEERMIKKGLDPEAVMADRRAKRSKAPSATPNSRNVAGTKPAPPRNQTPKDNASKDDASGLVQLPPEKGDVESPPNGIVRQQIQRQQPARQSRSNRTTPKKK